MAVLGISARAQAHDLSDLARELDELESLGVDFVELPLWNLDVLAAARPIAARLERLLLACRDRPYRFSVHGPIGLNLMDDLFRIANDRAVLEAYVEVTARLGADHLVIHTGHCQAVQAAGLTVSYAQQREALAATGEVARRHGVVLCVENVFTDDVSRHTASPARLAAELRAVAHPHVRATMDFSHGYLHCTRHGLDLTEEIAALAPLAAHLHLHDSFGRPDDLSLYSDSERLAFGVGDLHLPLGWGSVPWADLLARCRFPSDVMAVIELNDRHWGEAKAAVVSGRKLLSQMQWIG